MSLTTRPRTSGAPKSMAVHVRSHAAGRRSAYCGNAVGESSDGGVRRLSVLRTRPGGMAGRRGNWFFRKAWITTVDGKLQVYDVGG